MLEYIRKTIGKENKNAVIWLHGLGANGHDFEPIIPQLNLPKSANIDFIFPHAPSRPITINNGFVMPGWYDIKNFNSIDSNIDIEGIKTSVKAILTLIEKIKSFGILSKKIVLAGFSQGGAIASYTSLFSDESFAGLLALSAYLPGFNQLKSEIKITHKAMPISIAHGLSDPVVPLKAGKHMHQIFQKLGFDAKLYQYPMEHSICLEEIKMISQFLSNTFNF